MDTSFKDLIKKNILYAGTNSGFPEGTKVTFHIKVQICDDEKELDDSRKWHDPVELILGKKFKLEVLEACLKSMRLKEISKFQIDKKLLSSYPVVARTLRDHDAKKSGRSVPEERKSHCCGHGMKQGFGYADLDEYAANPKDLLFTIEILNTEIPGSYEKEFWAMTEDEQRESILVLREQGNALYKEHKYKEAANKYAEAIGRIESFMLKEKPNDVEWNELNSQKIPFLLNYSQCQLLLGEYYSVIEHCSEVLNHEPDNVKALFRRGKAFVKVFSAKEAREDIDKVIKLDPSLASGCRKILEELAVNEKEKLKQDKKAFQRLFS